MLRLDDIKQDEKNFILESAEEFFKKSQNIYFEYNSTNYIENMKIIFLNCLYAYAIYKID